jgi:hypothetical protein
MFFEVILNSFKLNARLVEFALGREAFHGKCVPRVPLTTVRVSGPPHAVGSTAANRLPSSFWALSPVFSANRAFYVLVRAKNFLGNHEFRRHLAQTILQKIEKWKKWRNPKKKTTLDLPRIRQRKSKKQSAKKRQNRAPGKSRIPTRQNAKRRWRYSVKIGVSIWTILGDRNWPLPRRGQSLKEIPLSFCPKRHALKKVIKTCSEILVQHGCQIWLNMVAKFGSNMIAKFWERWMQDCDATSLKSWWHCCQKFLEGLM